MDLAGLIFVIYGFRKFFVLRIKSSYAIWIGFIQNIILV
jgi:hypothetical protein